MANIVQLKRSSVAGRIPDAANISVGEPVINLADQVLYTKDGSGSVIVIGAGTTSNIAEGTNQYFTNARARASISVTGYGTYDPSTGVINITGSGGGGGGSSLTVSNSTPIVSSGTMWFQPQINGGGTIYIAYNGVWQEFAKTTIGYANNGYFDNSYSRVQLQYGIEDLANVNAYSPREGDVLTYTQGEWRNAPVGGVTFTTDAVAEATNLYFTNARSRAAISVSGSGSYDSSTGIITITGGVSSVNGQTGNVSLTLPLYTSNLTNDSGYTTNTYVNTTFAGNTFVTSTFASNSYVNTNFASNSYVNSTFAGNTFVTSTFASNTYVSTTYAANTYVNTTFASNTYTQTNYTSRARAFTMAVLFR
jgi:hypothetical protein